MTMRTQRHGPWSWIALGVLAPLAVLATEIVIRACLSDPVGHDIGRFYDSAQRWQQGVSPYPETAPFPNLNPPLVVQTLFAGLLAWPLHLAARVWFVLSGACLVGTLGVIAWRCRWRAETLAWVSVVTLLAYPSLHVWNQGQLTWILLPLMTAAWFAYRSSASARAGWWLGGLIAMKPFLVVIPLLLGWRLAAHAAAVSLALVSGSAILGGLEPWRAWLDAGTRVVWLARIANHSLWSVVARLDVDGTQAVMAVGDLPPWAPLAVIAVGGGLAWRIIRLPHGDARWFAAGLLALLVSPLGWGYYLPLWLGPWVVLSTTRPIRWPLVLGTLALLVPPPLIGAQHHGWGALLLGSFYTWACGLLLFGTLRRPRDRQHGEQDQEQQHFERGIAAVRHAGQG